MNTNATQITHEAIMTKIGIQGKLNGGIVRKLAGIRRRKTYPASMQEGAIDT